MINSALQTRYGVLQTFSDKPGHPLIHLKQTHSTIFRSATAASQGLEGDGFLWCQQTNDETFALQTADCLPVLIEGDHGWALAHLGWKGLADKMIQQEMIERLKPTHLWIGPHISRTHYEVQKDFTKNFPQNHNFSEKEGKLFFDLQTELLDQCTIFGELQVALSPACTYTDETLHSFRRNKTNLRNWTIFKSIERERSHQ